MAKDTPKGPDKAATAGVEEAWFGLLRELRRASG